MTDPQELLAAERRRTAERLLLLRADHAEVVEASRDTNADDEHDPEGQTIAYERSQVATLVRQAERHLDEVDAALVRVDDGTWGLCESCGARLPVGRLEARPTARTCVGCAG